MAQSRKNKKAQATRARTQKFVMLAIVAVVVLAGGVAIVSGGSSGGSTPTDSTAVAGGPGEYQDSEIVGDSLPQMPDTGEDSAIGMKVPEIRAKNFDGGPVSLRIASIKRPTMVVFLAHWCPHCNREIPRILELDSKGGIPSSLRVVGVATGSRDDQPNWPPSTWLDDMGWKWETAADSQDQKIFSAYGGTSFPTMVLVAPDGTVKNRFSGEVEVDDLGTRIKTFMDSVGGA